MDHLRDGTPRSENDSLTDAHGLIERELGDILDPWEDPTCHGPHLLPAEPALDFPGETSRVLKKKGEKAYGGPDEEVGAGGLGEAVIRRTVTLTCVAAL